MALISGNKLGPYEVLAPLGAGGMGEVYRARDTRLERTVAIKILASHLSSSPELKQRFEREAKTVSSLNHAHICQLFDVGSQDGTDYLVMEFLEGETLAERLRKGPVPLNELLKIGIEVAEALEVAHRAGIIHRDLKPGNIMLTKSGAKLMDFGLAKPAALGAAASGSAPLLSAARTASGPSPMSPLTTAGSIVGTIQYMSPEQIEGKEADVRSDIFAFGAVLYEMATGKRAFEGKSQISVASAILEKDPDPISTTKPLTPPQFEHIVRRALDKIPDERWQTASDIRGELKWVATSPSSIALPAAVTGGFAKRERLAWIAAAIAIVAALCMAALHFSSVRAPAYVVRSQISTPVNASFTFVGDNGGPPVLSPDGQMLAFVAANAEGKQEIYVRPLASLEARELSGTENAWAPFWSPDARHIGFFANAKLMVVDVQGGAPHSVVDAPNGRGGSWSRDGTIIFAPDFRSVLYRVPSGGGKMVAVTQMDESKHTSHRWPFFLPDGKHFLYLAVNHESPRSEGDAIYFASTDGKENIRLKTAFTNPQFGSGSLLYVRDGELVAQTLDPSSGKLSGEEQPIVNGVNEDDTTWRGIFAVSNNGVLIYSAGQSSMQSQLAWFDRTGKRLGTVGDKFGALAGGFRLSPDGGRVAMSIQGSTADIWVQDVARGVRTRLTFGPTGNGYPVWSPDGQWIAYESITKNGNVIARRPASGGPEEVLVSDSTIPQFPSWWSRDGKYLVYRKGADGTHTEIWALPLAGDGQPFEVLPPGPFRSSGPHLSPDGKWLAYSSDESGRNEIYVVPFRGNGGKWQVSTEGGGRPIWRNDGKEIFYLGLNGAMIAVPVTEQDSAVKLGAPQTLFHTTFGGFDVAPGGQKFLMTEDGDRGSQQLTLVTNWEMDIKK